MQKNKNQKAQHNHRCELGCCAGLHMNRSANETNQKDYLLNGCGVLWVFPTWICLMDTEPPLFISAQTEQRTSTVLSGIWFGWRICNCFSIFPQHFYHLLLDRITLTKSSTKVTNVESAFTVTSTYENIEKKISRAL